MPLCISLPRFAAVLAWCVLLFAAVPVRAQNVTAFPGAVGFGSPATGGRGDAVYHVTNLNDSGTGSFRDAVSQSNRFIVFDIGGYVVLQSAVSAKSNLTIAGQTAPGQGIGIMGREVSFDASTNIICRYVRFRQGDLDPDGSKSGINILNANIVIFDHCSVEFAQYDTIDGSPCGNITVQNSIIADAIGQQFGAHVQQLTATSANTWINNLWVNLQNRQPLAKTYTQYINNVIYNYIDAYTNEDSAGVSYHDVLDNYFISGPASAPDTANNWYQLDTNANMYCAGNLLDNNFNGILDGSATAPTGITVLSTPYFSNSLSLATRTAPNAYTYDIANAGTLPRDSMDTLIVNQIQTLGQGTTGQGAGTTGPDPNLYFSQIETGLPNGGYGTLSGGNTYFETNQDGLPDYWKEAMGMNITLAYGNLTAANGYTNLENYVNWLAGPHAIAIENNSVNIDLTAYTLGLANPAFVLSNAVNGTVLLLADNHTAQFTPTSGFTGAGNFTYAVTGTALTGNVAVVVTPTTPIQVPPATSNITPVPLTWQGDGVTNAWDLTSLNWLNGTTATNYADGDNLTFNDTGSASPSITLSQTVLPGSMVVNSSHNYTLTGSGQLSGSMSLTKLGTGSLTLASANSYIGGTTITAGTLSIGNLSCCEGLITLNGGTLDLAIGGNVTNALNVTANSTLNIDVSSGTLSGVIIGNATLNITGLSSRLITFFQSTSGFYGTFELGSTTSGTLRLFGLNGSTLGSNGSANAVFDLGTGSAALTVRNGNVTVNFGALEGAVGTSVKGGTLGNTTFSIGNLNTNTTFSGAILNADSANITYLTKVGTGILSLNGTSTYTGPTLVSSGSLLVDGALGNTSITVSSGATFGGNGTVNNAAGNPVVFTANSSLAPGPASGQAGTLKIGAGGLSLNSTTLLLDLTSSPSGANDAITLAGGALTFTHLNSIQLDLLNGTLGAGNYALISGGASTSGSVANLSVAALADNNRQSLVLSTPTGGLTLTVANSAPASLVWTGAANGTWGLGSASNWSNGGSADKFYTADSVSFTDTGANTTIIVAGSVQPGSLVFSNTAKAYTITGSGAITGSAQLIKSGAGSLTLNTANTFSGGAQLNAGTVTLGNATALGTGAVTLNGTTLILPANVTFANPLAVTAASILTATGNNTLTGAFTGSANLTSPIGAGQMLTFQGNASVFSGTLLAQGPGILCFNNSANWGLPLAALNLTADVTADNASTGNFTLTLGALSGDATSTFTASDQAAASGTTCTLLIGNLGLATTFNGTLADSANQHLALTKTGAASLTLAGNSTCSGNVSVQSGTLVLAGSLNNPSRVDVASGATLDLASSSLTTANLTIESGATLTGNGTITGTLTLNGTATSGSGGVLAINGSVTNNGVLRLTAGTQLAVTGAFINNGILDLITSGSGLPSGLVNHGTVLLASSVSQVASFGVSGATATLQIQSYVGHNFQLQSAASLSGAWQNIGSPQTGTGATLTFTDPAYSANPMIFYRIVVSP
jgi:autotransporter-associated beta strand protein